MADNRLVTLFLKGIYLLQCPSIKIYADPLICSQSYLYLRMQWKPIFGNVICCSALRLWVGYFMYFELITMFFSMDVFKGCSLIELNKWINRLLNKGTSNNYLKVTELAFSKLQFSKFRKATSFCGVPTHTDIIEF